MGKHNGSGYTKFESLRALTQTQKEYIKAIHASVVTIAVGAPGSGKTYVPSSLASEYYYKGEVERITIIRPTVPASRPIGFIPGDAQEKMEPWATPILEVIEEKLGAKYYDGRNNGTIYAYPIMYLRGSTLRNSFIIIDDAQNLTKEELHLILTRIGEGSKVVMTGDLSQSDIFVENGLSFVMKKIQQLELSIPIITFETEDICRSQTCQLWHTIFTSSVLEHT